MDIPVVSGKQRFRHVLTLALLAAGAGGAWATRLDKTACADLNTELSGLLASGLKEDMDKGPAWAAAKLSPERLASINRVIELQGQIEFRCGAPSGHNVAKAPNAKSPGDKTSPDTPAENKASTAKSNNENSDDGAPATKPKGRTLRHKRGSAATNPDLPAVVPASMQPPRVNSPPAVPAVTAVKAAPEVAAGAPATATPTKPAPELEKTAATAPPVAPLPPQASRVTPVSTTPQAAFEAKEAKKVPTVAPVTAPRPALDQAGATVPGAHKAAAKKQASRRDSSSAYVSPRDVNTYGLPTGN